MTEVDPISPTSLKQSFIAEHVRRQIIEGRLPPGRRLPTQVSLAASFQVSGVTIQRALDRLVREGFICTRGRNGTFVTSHPPHLHSYGVVFKDAPQAGRSRYHELLEAKALRLPRTEDRRVRIFNGISGHEDSAGSSELLALVRSHQIAGLLLIDADGFLETPLLDEAGIFRAAVMSRKVDNLSCPIVFPDMTGMVDLALDEFLKSGRRKIATLTSVGVHANIGEYLRHAMLARGLEADARWRQIVPYDCAEAVRNTVLLLMGSPSDRPDALFIADDNLVEAASSGLIAAGVSVPGDVLVVSHCNFPAPESVLPMGRVGFNTDQILETAINVIDLQRQGKRVASVTRVPASVESASSNA